MSVDAYLTPHTVSTLLRVLLTLVGGLVLGRLLAPLAGRLLRRSAKPGLEPLARRLAQWGVIGLAAASALDQLGFDLSVLLGAAGLLTVAVGFASQTSASNLVSGLFLMLEGSLSIGDVVRIGTTTGEVVSIDPLSVKLRTFDNLLVRVPNETLVKSEFTNLSRFPIRRVELRLAVTFGADLARVEAIFREAADADERVLQEPAPAFWVLGTLESGVDLQLNAWTRRETVLDVRTALLRALLEAFRAQGVQLALPHRVLAAGGDAVPVRLVPDDPPFPAEAT